MPDSPEDQTDPLVEQALRLGDLRKEVMDRIGGPVIEGGTGELPMDMQEAFWKQVLAFESAEESTLAERLKKDASFVPIEPDRLHEENEIHSALWELINALASIRVFLCFTDHLSDTDLYRLLCYDALPSPSIVPPPGSRMNEQIMACEFGTKDDPEGTETWLRYYADEDTRLEWDGDVPPTQLPPFDRDRLLPGPPEEA